MDEDMHVEWPVEMLGRFLHFLAMDGASFAWQHLAYLTHKNDSLKRIAQKMRRPLVLRLNRDTRYFILPFEKAHVAQIEIDWGDDTPTQIIESVGEGYISHAYTVYAVSDSKEFVVRVFPHGAGINNVWLDHLGWSRLKDRRANFNWNSLTSFDTLGSLGISSLEARFRGAQYFRVPLSTWDTLRRTKYEGKFCNALHFNQPIGSWNVCNVTDMSCMFVGAKNFNHPIGGWNVGRVKTMRGMFEGASLFDQPIGDWDVSNVDVMSLMFRNATAFNSDISRWDVSSVWNMSGMFNFTVVVGNPAFTQFNQPLEAWNVSNVRHMGFMFGNAHSFNQPLGGWDVSNVEDMSFMFWGTSFNNDIGDWDVSKVKFVVSMFRSAQ